MNKQQMLESVRDYLSYFNKPFKEILQAMKEVDRIDFMPEELKDKVYIDTAMPIGHGQTISQPSTVARMLQLLELKKGDSVLEIGTGSGWNAALMGFIVGGQGRILTLEIVRELFENAKQKLKRYRNVQVEKKVFQKLKEKFDKIIFTAGVSFDKEEVIEKFAKEHLNDNGILVCPFQAGHLIIIKKIDEQIKKEYTKEEYVFVKLIL